ncbi:MAG: HAD family hydrolase [Kastovskya adunca ATA6-11-RM4]|jgi:HAD superfamily hydrolase (TIGR01509 family)|nr:HAD family hydrolase [Kastovskya adunca ATA6-11-RM4]
MELQGVILDVDGTLVLSNDAHAQAWVEAFADSGYEVPFEKVRPLIGMGGDKVLPKLVPELNDEEGDGKKISQRRKELVINHYAANLKPTNGSRQLVLQMQRAGLKLIVASSATSEELSLLLKAAQVDDLLTETTSSSDADNSKPAPDIVEVALKKLDLPPSEVVMLGDTPYDIEAAGGCGVGVIAVRSGGFDDEQLKGAIGIYDDPAALLADYFRETLGEDEA